jgi:hypothetical protein
MDDVGIELRPGQEGEDHGTRGREEPHPLRVGGEDIAEAEEAGGRRSDNSHTDFDECDREAQGRSKEGRNNGEGEP